MRNRPGFEGRRNYNLFLAVVCEGQTLEQGVETVTPKNEKQITRPRALEIIRNTAGRIASTTGMDNRTMKTITGGIREMRKRPEQWKKFALESFKVISKGETL